MAFLANPPDLSGQLRAPTVFTTTARAFNTAYLNTLGRPIWLQQGAGVISLPGQNGHIYLCVGSDAAGSGNLANQVDFVSDRNDSSGSTYTEVGGTGESGNGQGLQGFVPIGYYYQLVTQTIAGWNAPTFVTVGSLYVVTF